MPTNNLIRRLFTRSLRNQKVPPIRKNSGPLGLRIEQLEDRVVPSGPAFDSGGGSGQLSSGALVDQSGGTLPLIPNVSIQPIYLQDSNSHKVQSHANFDTFLSNFVTGAYIPALLSQYTTAATTIGTGSVGPNDLNAPVTPDTTDSGFPAISDGLIQNVIQAEIDSGRTAASDGVNNLYVVFTPPGDVVVAGGADSINFFLGYHSNFQDSTTGNQDYYAVIPDQNFPNANLGGSPLIGGDGETAVQGEQQVITHETSEAITDPTPNAEWFDPNNGENGDMAANQSYTMNGGQAQYMWSQFATPTTAATSIEFAMGTGANDLALAQLVPPAVSSWHGGPVASFVTNNTSLTAANFTAFVDFADGFGALPATVTGSNGHFTVNATPVTQTLSPGQYGTAFTQTGMYVYIYDTAAGALGSGIPSSIRYQPFTVAPTAHMIYNAETPSATNNFRLVANGTDYDIFDNGLLVMTQPKAATTAIDINGANAGDTLTVDFSGGSFAVPINWTPAPGNVGGLKITGETVGVSYVFTDAHSGSVLVGGGPGGSIINYTGVGSITDTGASNKAFVYNSTGSTITLAAGPPGSDTITSNTGATVTFTNPPSLLTVNADVGADTITANQLDGSFGAGLTLSAQGSSASTVALNTSAAGQVQVNSGGSINVTKALNTGANSVSLTAGTNINQTAAITSGFLVTSSVSGTNLGSATNMVTVFHATNGPNGSITLTDGTSLTVSGITQSGSGNVNVTVTGSNSALTVTGPVTGGGGRVTLQATGNLTVSAGLTVNSGAGALVLGADLTAAGAGDDGTGTLTINGTVSGSNITLRGADINIAPTAVVGGAATGGVTIRSSVASRPMSIGGTNNAAVAGINLTSAELARIATQPSGTLTIGDAAQTGNITFSGATTTTAGASIVVLQSSTGPGQIVLDTSTGIALNGNGGRVIFVSGLGGVTAALSPTFAALKTNGFSATGLTLNLALSFAPVLGQQFTLINDTGGAISGAFSNLGPGGIISTTFNGTPYSFQANFSGGTGHDLVLTDVTPTNTGVTSSAGTVAYGQQVTLTATVTALTGAAAPTGSVEFFDDTTGADLGAGALQSSTGTTSIWTLTTGARQLQVAGGAAQAIRAVFTSTGTFAGGAAALAGGVTVTPIGVTVSGITANSRVYNGTAVATLNTAGAVLVGVLAGDTVTLNTSGATGTFASKAAGTGILVTVSGLTLSGPQAGDYVLTQPTTSADITPALPTRFAVGSATGGFVSVYDNGVPIVSNIHPYGAFQGGIAVAEGDVNGDGVQDLVTVVASGGPAEVKVFDGATGAQILDFLAFPAFYTGGASVAVADLDGTGKDEIIVGTSTGVSAVAVFDGTTGARRALFVAYPGAPVGVDVAAGQLDGTGKAQIVTVPTTLAPLVRVFGGDGTLVNGFMAGPAIPGGAFTVAVGNLNGSATDQIMVGANVFGTDFTLVFNSNGAEQAALQLPVAPSPPPVAGPQLPVGMFRALANGELVPSAPPPVGPQMAIANLNGRMVLLFAVETFLGAYDGPSLGLLGTTLLYPSPFGPLFLG
jgi:hypothetical protein